MELILNQFKAGTLYIIIIHMHCMYISKLNITVGVCVWVEQFKHHIKKYYFNKKNNFQN